MNFWVAERTGYCFLQWVIGNQGIVPNTPTNPDWITSPSAQGWVRVQLLHGVMV